MIRYIVSMVCVALVVAFVGYATTSFVPPAPTGPEPIIIWGQTTVDGATTTTPECVRVPGWAGAASVGCGTALSAYYYLPQAVVLTGAHVVVKTAGDSGYECDIELWHDGIVHADSVTASIVNGAVGDIVTAVWPSITLAADERIGAYVISGAGQDCSGTVDPILQITFFGMWL